MRSILSAVSVLALLSLAAGCRQRTDVAGTVTCTPGEVIEVGCAQGCGIGSCEGDPTLRLCDGTLSPDACSALTDTSMYVQVDDSSCGGLCADARVTCPASGLVTVVPGAVGGSRTVCNWASRSLGTPRGAEIVACTPGAAVQVGCSDACGIGSCTLGTARLRICDGTVGTSACQSGPSGSWVYSVTSSEGSSCDTRCPEAVVTCPASGTLAVSPSSSSTAGGDYFCRWETVEHMGRPSGTVDCTPGARIVVGCAAGCNVGSCFGQGAIRVCDGGISAADCLAAASPLAREYGSSSCDDACPGAVLTCPPSGAITVAVEQNLDPQEGFACDWAVRAAGLGE